MEQLFFIEPGKVEWRDVPAPRIESPDDALVRPLAVAMCDLDRAILRGDAPVPGPFALGHEFVAEVVEAGPGARTLVPGSRVIVPFQVSCGSCAFCRRGLTAACTEAPGNAMYGLGAAGGDWGGAIGDLVRVPFAPAMLVPLPEGVAPTTAASLSDNVADAWRCVAPPLEDRPGADVLIVSGAAVSIALYAVEIALAAGAGRVDYLDTDPERLALAESLGAHPVEGPPPRRLGPYPITVDASGTHRGLACAVRSVEPGGVCTSAAIYYEPETPVPMLEMYTSGAELRASRVNSRTVLPAVAELVATGRIDPGRVTSRIVPFGEAAEALADPPTKLVLAR